MKNKTATESWNILKGEIDSAIDSYVPMKKQGKQSKKKHVSKETFRKNRHKKKCGGCNASYITYHNSYCYVKQ